MAECHNAMAPYLVPGYDWLQKEALRFTGVLEQDSPLVLDLAGGSGIFLEKLLSSNDTARAIWLDSSEAFREVAQQRLHRFGDRVEFIISRLEDDWGGSLSSSLNCVFSMCAIHHLTHGEKRDVYRQSFEVLADGGWFCNIDEAIPRSEKTYLNAMDFWVQHVHEAKDNIPQDLWPLRDEWLSHFDKWKIRNVDQYDRPKEKGDDIHAPITDQLDWLEEAGLNEVDIYVKYHLWAIMAGRKT